MQQPQKLLHFFCFFIRNCNENLVVQIKKRNFALDLQNILSNSLYTREKLNTFL